MKLTVNAKPQSGIHSFLDLCDIFRTAGFDALDFSLSDLVNDDSEMYQSNPVEYAERIKRDAEERGLSIRQTHAPFLFQNWDDETHFESVIFPRIVRSLEMSAIMGARITVVHPLHHRVYRGHEDEIFELNMKFYRRLIPYCKEYGIQVAIENMFQKDSRRRCYLIDACNTKEDFIRYIDTLDSEYMVACLDIGHVGLPHRDDEAQDMIRALGHDRLKTLHVHDNSYTEDQHTLPFLGKIDWAEVTRALADIRYDGDLNYEVNTALLNTSDQTFTPLAAKFMADVGRHLIRRIEEQKKR